MNAHCVKFLESIDRISTGAKEANHAVKMEWLPDAPPVTILFAVVAQLQAAL